MNGTRCPVCNSNQVTATKKGLSFKKAALGGLLAGPLGLALGALHGSGEIELVCLKCYHRWKPGDEEGESEDWEKDEEEEIYDKAKKQGFPAYDDGYLTCNKCEKRWLAHDVHHEESMTKTEREKFLQGKGCPYCSGSEKH